MTLTNLKKPDADFVIRLVKPGLKPWLVPMRTLARLMQAIERLVDPFDDDPADPLLRAKAVGSEDEANVREKYLRLLAVTSGSAAYSVAAFDRRTVTSRLKLAGRAIERPDAAEWTGPLLSSIQELSEIAKARGCTIELHRDRADGEVLATIGPETYSRVAKSALVEGFASIPARIERVGGATEMHCGIRLPDQPRKMVICRVDGAPLIRDLGQCIYQEVVLSGQATWFRHDHRLRTMVISEVDRPAPGTLLEALQRIHDVGGHAWDSVADPESSIAEMRGA